jgi:C-methyltransferase
MTEMLSVPVDLVPPFMRSFASAMLYGLWGWMSRQLQLVVKAGVADILGEEPQSAASLAAATGCNADALDRFLRALAGCDIFERLPDGTYRHTPISRCLRRDAPMSAAPSAQLQATPIYQVALSNLEHTLRTGRPAIEGVAPSGFFAYLRGHPEEARVFDQAMSSLMAADNGQIVGAYDFSQSKVIADIGGGQGALVRAILERVPDVQTILFDLADVVAGIAPAARLQILAGDFLTDSLPSADLHILKLILHDWPDQGAARILSAVRRAARMGGKVLVIEPLMSEAAGFHASNIMDVSMLALVGGRERTPRQFQQLFSESGFRFLRVIPTTSPVAQIVEAEAI